MASERIDGATPNGGAYTVIEYLQTEQWLPCEPDDADRAVVQEFDENDQLVFETVGTLGAG